VWYGSPQWQIEALRRLEIQRDLRGKFRFQPLGAADGEIKRAILGGNAARLYRMKADKGAYRDRIAARKEGLAAGQMETDSPTKASGRAVVFRKRD